MQSERRKGKKTVVAAFGEGKAHLENAPFDAWLRYRKIYEAESARINPQIEAAYDRLATQCEEAQALLRDAE